MMIFYPFPPGREKDRTSISTRRVMLNPAGGVFDIQKIANQWNNEYRLSP